MKTKAFENGTEKNVVLLFPSAFSVVLLWTTGKNASKSMRFHTKTVQCGQVKTKRKRYCGRKYFSFLSLRRKRFGDNMPRLSKDIKLSSCVLFGGRSRSLCRQTIGYGGTVAAYVAETGERLFVRDILGVISKISNLFPVFLPYY